MLILWCLTEVDYLCAAGDFSRIGALRLRNIHGAFEHSLSAGPRCTPPLLVLKKMLSASLAAELDKDTAKDFLQD